MKKLVAILALSIAMGGFASAQPDEFDETDLLVMLFAWSHSDDRAFAIAWANPTTWVPEEQTEKPLAVFTYAGVMFEVDTMSERYDPTSESKIQAYSLSAVGEEDLQGMDTMFEGDPIFETTWFGDNVSSDGMDSVGVATAGGKSTAEGFERAWTIAIAGADTEADFNTCGADAWGLGVSMSDYDCEGDIDDLPNDEILGFLLDDA